MSLPRPAEIFDLSGRVALVTGGAGHLGGEFARVLGGAGARLALLDVDRERLASRAAELESDGLRDVLTIAADVGVEGEVERGVAAVRERFGALHILVNNAAAKSPAYFSTLEELPIGDWDRVLATNLTGMFLCTKAALPLLRAAAGGAIVNLASIYGVVSPDPRIYEGSELQTPPVYPASKGGVLALTRYIAAYHAKEGIRCNSITPGGVFAGHAEEFVRRYSDRVPLRRMAEAREIAHALLFLVSDAAAYVTGHNLVVDGGLTAW